MNHPNLACIAIGDELLNGRSHDTNSQRLAGLLKERGLSLAEVRLVRDDLDEIHRAVTELASRNSIIFTSGGMGSTRDDLTREALAAWLGCELRQDEEAWQRIKSRAYARQAELTEERQSLLRKQAQYPKAARPIRNPVGMALGVAAEHGGTQLFALPGVPGEFIAMARACLSESLGEVQGTVRTRFVLYGLLEAELELRLSQLELPPVRVAMLAHSGPLDLIFSGPEGQVEAAAKVAEDALGEFILSRDCEPEEKLGQLLVARQEKIATVESCTGGMVAALITSVPGSSAYFDESCVTYSNAAKTRAVGVAPELLERYGAVSPQCAEAMAKGLQEATGADWALSITGIAGPGGGSPEKPVGTVYLGLVGPHGYQGSKLFVPNRPRHRVRRDALYRGLAMAIGALDQAQK